MTASRTEDLDRVRQALDVGAATVADLVGSELRPETKAGGDPVTAADHAINAALRDVLPRDGEGWLSEESHDDEVRLAIRRVWVVDPLDGTREFITGLPEWCISVGLVEDGQPVVGGVCNPGTGETMLGAVGLGVTLNGRPASPRKTRDLRDAEVLASRSEFDRGEWRRFADGPFRVRPCGSVAYKLALVAVGLTDASWTLVPKHEWDVAAGVALVRAAGGDVWIPGDRPLVFNRRDTLLPGLVATAPGLTNAVRGLLAGERPAGSR